VLSKLYDTIPARALTEVCLSFELGSHDPHDLGDPKRAISPTEGRL
jgi:hypothetical protein